MMILSAAVKSSMSTRPLPLQSPAHRTVVGVGVFVGLDVSVGVLVGVGVGVGVLMGVGVAVEVFTGVGVRVEPLCWRAHATC